MLCADFSDPVFQPLLENTLTLNHFIKNVNLKFCDLKIYLLLPFLLGEEIKNDTITAITL